MIREQRSDGSVWKPGFQKSDFSFLHLQTVCAGALYRPRSPNFMDVGFGKPLNQPDGSCQAGLICRSLLVRRFQEAGGLNNSQVGGGQRRTALPPAEARSSAGADQEATGQNNGHV